jgi:transposase
MNSLRPDDVLFVEACPGSYYLHDLLSPAVAQVNLVNPIHFGKLLNFFQHKTDRNDSGLLVRLARVGELPTVWVPDKEVRDARGYAEHRKDLDQERTRLRNRIHSQLVEHGMGFNAESILKMDPQGILVAVNTHLPALARETLASNLRLLAAVEEELRRADATIVAQTAARQAPRQDVVEIAMSLPGVADFLGFVIAASIGEPQRFKTSGSLANYAGLTPALHSSGAGKPKHGRITKRGSALLRYAAIEAAENARRVPGRFKNFYQRVFKRTKNHGKAIVACARELLEILWHLLRKNEKYQELSLEVQARKEKRRRDNRRKAEEVLKTRPDTRRTILNNLDRVCSVLDALSA